MRSIKIAGLCLVAAFAMSAVAASSASAAEKPGLFLKVGGTRVVSPAKALAGTQLDGCALLTEGTVTSGGKTDKGAFKGDVFGSCFEEGVSIEGEIESATIKSSTEKISYKADIVISNGKCAYEFKKLGTGFKPNEGLTTGLDESAVGKLDKAKSPEGKACEKTLTTTATVGVVNPETGEAFETELT